MDSRHANIMVKRNLKTIFRSILVLILRFIILSIFFAEKKPCSDFFTTWL